MNLASQKCAPCEAGGQPMEKEEIALYVKDVPEWHVSDDKKINRRFTFKDFREAMNFANGVGELAEQEGHHPDLIIKYGEVSIETWTHAVKGLTLNDFILAAKIDKLERQ